MTSVSNLAMEEEAAEEIESGAICGASEEMLAKTLEALDKLEERIPPVGSAAKGPRNIPQPDARKRRRQVAKAARKANR